MTKIVSTRFFETQRCNLSDASSIIAHEPKPLVHHYNHKAEKPPRGQAQRGRKLQFEDFEWYENPANLSGDIPGKGEGRRLPKRLSKAARRQGQVIADVDSCEAGEPDEIPVSRPHPRFHPRPRRNQGFRSR